MLLGKYSFKALCTHTSSIFVHCERFLLSLFQTSEFLQKNIDYLGKNFLRTAQMFALTVKFGKIRRYI